MAFVVTSYPNQPSAAALASDAARGLRPRSAYVELARLLHADVIDSCHLAERARPLARAVSRWAGLASGQVCEAFLRRRSYRTICAFADRLGLPLALLFKWSRTQCDVVLVSGWLSRPRKALFLKPLNVHSHLRAIVNYSSVQMEYAASRLGVPRHKLYLALQPVDDRFWAPEPRPCEKLICAVGWEARDYPTLLEATRGMDVELELALGIAGLVPPGPSADGTRGPSDDGADAGRDLLPFQPLRRTYSYRLHENWSWQIRHDPPDNVKVHHQLSPPELRSLYARSRFVVVPLHDVDSDCGVTTVTEAMAMGKAVILSRTRGQRDIVRDGVEGIYVPPGDPVSLRSAIQHLLAHPEEAERMGRAGRELVGQRHTLDAYVQRLAELVVHGHGDGRSR